jgi:Zn-dependent metalloprotease
LVWKVNAISHTGRFNWIYFIDALDGAIIKKQDNIDYDNGTGNVYLKHPFLTPNTTTVTLENLDGSGYLRGTYADVFTSEEDWFQQQEPNQRAQSASLNFEYSPSDWRFDEANVYYHINVFKQWMSDNYHSSSQGQVTARVHELDPENAAFFSPPNSVTFGEGSGAGYNDHAREDAVIYHEYTHAMVWPIVDFQTSLPDYAETGAISEGLADYFPGSFTSRSLKGEYVREGFVPREDYPGAQRDMAAPLIDHYDRYNDEDDPVWQTAQNLVPPKPFQEIHIGGEFFASILWDIRGAIGQSVADELAWDALYQVTSTAEFTDCRIAMVNLDFIEYNSAHIPTIESKFDAKGVYAPLDARITGPGSLLQGEQGTWDSNPTGGQGTRTYKWYVKEPPSAPLWTQVGTAKTYTRTHGHVRF